jgi:hypothetical protein
MEMASKTQKTEKIRARKHTPNTVNEKAERKRLMGNVTLIRELEGENRK